MTYKCYIASDTPLGRSQIVKQANRWWVRMHGRRAASIIPQAFSRLTKPTCEVALGPAEEGRRAANAGGWPEGMKLCEEFFHGYGLPFRERVNDIYCRVDRFWFLALARRYRRAILSFGGGNLS